jgi:hypothetical protein
VGWPLRRSLMGFWREEGDKFFGDGELLLIVLLVVALVVASAVMK